MPCWPWALTIGLVLGVALPAHAEFVPEGCRTVASLKAVKASRPSAITFVNATNAMIRTWLIDERGTRVFSADIAPGRSRREVTFIDQPWIVTSGSVGLCVAVYRAEETESSAVIEAPPDE